MIISTSPISINIMSPSDKQYVHIESRLDIKNEDYIIHTEHYFISNGIKTSIHKGIEFYNKDQINSIYNLLKDSLISLPFTEQITTGIEIMLLDYINNIEIYGIKPKSNGWIIN